MEQQLTAGLAERQVSKFIDDVGALVARVVDAETAQDLPETAKKPVKRRAKKPAKRAAKKKC